MLTKVNWIKTVDTTFKAWTHPLMKWVRFSVVEYFIQWNGINLLNYALRALVPYVLYALLFSYLKCLVSYVLLFLMWLVPYVLFLTSRVSYFMFSRISRALCPTWSPASCAFCLTCSCASLVLYSRCSRSSYFTYFKCLMPDILPCISCLLLSLSWYFETFWCFTKFFYHHKWNEARLLVVNMVYTICPASCETA